MPYFSAIGRILLMYVSGFLNSSAVGTKTGASSGTVNANSSVLLIEYGGAGPPQCLAAAAACGDSGTGGAPGLTRGETRVVVRGAAAGDGGFGGALLPAAADVAPAVDDAPAAAAAAAVASRSKLFAVLAAVAAAPTPAALPAFSSFDTILRGRHTSERASESFSCGCVVCGGVSVCGFEFEFSYVCLCVCVVYVPCAVCCAVSHDDGNGTQLVGFSLVLLPAASGWRFVRRPLCQATRDSFCWSMPT